MSFLLVLLVVILAYGVFQRALLYMDMNTHPALVFQLLYKPFLLMFGELNVEDSRKCTGVFQARNARKCQSLFIILIVSGVTAVRSGHGVMSNISVIAT